jgi:hypothetical protein
VVALGRQLCLPFRCTREISKVLPPERRRVCTLWTGAASDMAQIQEIEIKVGEAMDLELETI